MSNVIATLSATTESPPGVLPANTNPVAPVAFVPETIAGVVVMCGHGALVGMELPKDA